VVREVSPAGRAHPDPTVRELNEYATALEKRLTKLLQRPVQVAYGRPVLGADQISRSYTEARMALDLGERLRIDRVCGFDDMRVDSALLGLAQDAAGRVFADDVLAPLRADRGSLLEVAREYVSAGGNVNESARRLGIPATPCCTSSTGSRDSSSATSARPTPSSRSGWRCGSRYSPRRLSSLPAT
jgi:sugar diacid utilization regulator